MNSFQVRMLTTAILYAAGIIFCGLALLGLTIMMSGCSGQSPEIKFVFTVPLAYNPISGRVMNANEVTVDMAGDDGWESYHYAELPALIPVPIGWTGTVTNTFPITSADWETLLNKIGIAPADDRSQLTATCTLPSNAITCPLSNTPVPYTIFWTAPGVAQRSWTVADPAHPPEMVVPLVPCTVTIVAHGALK